ncbi:hypothetical protein HYP07_gp009 [Vibrio phage JSF3]|nr:hypothetical protein HYP07_gp009 [Vibrio phage JSF3]APD18021.1 hypothetical protein [Vibrio phage JSF3]
MRLIKHSELIPTTTSKSKLFAYPRGIYLINNFKIYTYEIN